jgi:hypothetical protein
MALGALPGQVVRSVVCQTLWLAGIGIAVGVPASMLLAGVVQNLPYGVTPADAATQAVAAALLGAVALLSSYLPARKADGSIRCGPYGTNRYIWYPGLNSTFEPWRPTRVKTGHPTLLAGAWYDSGRGKARLIAIPVPFFRKSVVQYIECMAEYCPPRGEAE